MQSTAILLLGIWRGILSTPGGELPFNIELSSLNGKYSAVLINGEDRQEFESVTVTGDSAVFQFAVYETALRAKIVDESRIEGFFINYTKTANNTIPFSAIAGLNYRFKPESESPAKILASRYAITYLPGTEDSSSAVGLFKQDGSRVTGTVMKRSGDSRYLEGTVTGDSLYLSIFDGIFAYLYKARFNGELLEGVYYSGNTVQRPWIGRPDPDASLPDPSSITSVKNTVEDFYFEFPDVDGSMVTLDDERFRQKVVIVQILGSWCPNCLDESRFLAPYYEKNRNRGIEIVGLAFEKTDEFSRAAANVQRLTERLNISYPVLIASNRSRIKETIPQLDNFIAFPTTIFLDRNHKVHKVHAGFSGPATGEEYVKFQKSFNETMELLLGK